MSMADDTRKRPEFLTDSHPPKAKDPASDPLAELARLIGQSDPFAEQSRASAPQAARCVPQRRPSRARMAGASGARIGARRDRLRSRLRAARRLSAGSLRHTNR